jgi:SsrA-binding protein
MVPAMALGSKGRAVAENRKARRDYLIEETLEAGLVLVGTEVKSLRLGRASINESYAAERGGELYLLNANIAEFPPAGPFNHEPKRPRKLLLHRREIARLIGAVAREGYTLVPLSLYFNERGRAKVRLGLARGRKKYDKRALEKERAWQREKARLLRGPGRVELAAPEEFCAAGRSGAKHVAVPTRELRDEPAAARDPGPSPSAGAGARGVSDRSADAAASPFAPRLADRLATAQRSRLHLTGLCSRAWTHEGRLGGL